jgi:hypothetical protein
MAQNDFSAIAPPRFSQSLGLRRRAMENFIIKKIPREKRFRKALIVLIATVGFTGWVLWYLYTQQQFGENVLWMLPFFLIGLWVSLHYWRTTEVMGPKEEEGKLQNQKIEGELWREIVGGFGALIILSGFLMIGWQIFTFLKLGEWVKLSLLVLAAFGPEKLAAWLVSPSSWFGLHKLIYGLLEFFPLSLFVMLVGVAVIAYGSNKSEA